MTENAMSVDRAEWRGSNRSTNDEVAHGSTGAQPPKAGLGAFMRAVANARYASPRLPTWWQAHAVHLEPGRCSYCTANVREAPLLDPIIPIVAGGPHSPHAVVLCCKGCKISRGRKDLLIWKPDAPNALKALRTQMAMEAWNHVTRDPAEMKTKAKAQAILARRWSQPRFYCHAAMIEEGGFIGWRDLTSVPSVVPLRLVFEHQAGRLHASARHLHRRHADSAIFWIPTRAAALDAIWNVIEQNSLVRPVDLGALSPPAEDASDPSDDLHLLLPTTADLMRRRWRQN